MNRPPLALVVEDQLLSICRLAPAAVVPSWATSASDGLVSITRTRDELSVVCPSAKVPSDAKQEPGWRAFKVTGPLDFGLTGVLLSVLDPLAGAGISVFSVSTFDTDYVLVKDARVAEAVQALRKAGHSVAMPPA